MDQDTKERLDRLEAKVDLLIVDISSMKGVWGFLRWGVPLAVTMILGLATLAATLWQG